MRNLVEAEGVSSPEQSGSSVGRVCHSAVLGGLAFLIGFTPLAFGSVQPWAYRTMEAVVLVLALAWIVKSVWEGRLQVAKLQLLIPLVLFIGVVLLQVLSLPPRALAFLSPATHELYGWTVPGDDGGPGGLRSISVYSHATNAELLKILSYLGVFLLVVNSVGSRRDVRFLLWALVIAGFVFSLFAIVQKYMWDGMAFWFIRLTPGRNPFGPYINKNHFAGYIGMILPLAIGMLLSQSYRSAPSGGPRNFWFRLADWGESERGRQLTLGFMVIVMASALFMSLSRGGMVSLLCAMLTVVALMAVHGAGGRWHFLLSGVGVFVFLFVVWVGYDEYVAERVSTLLSGQEMHRAMRPQIWREALPIFTDFPLFGTGLGTFGAIFPLYKAHPVQLHFLHPENDYLSLLTETGLAGAAAVLAAVALFAAHVMRRFFQLRDVRMIALAAGGVGSGVAMAVHSVFDFNLHVPANALHFALIMGLLVVMVNLRGGEREQRLTLPFVTLPLAGLGARWGHGVLGLALVSLLAMSVLSARRAPDATHYENAQGDFVQAVLAWQAKDPAGTLENGRKAVAGIRAALLLNPLNYQYHYHLGWTLGSLRVMGAAAPPGWGEGSADFERHFETSLRLYPSNARLHHAVATFYLLNWASLSPANRAFGGAAYRKSMKLTVDPGERAALREKTKQSLLLLKGKNLDPALRALVDGN